MPCQPVILCKCPWYVESESIRVTSNILNQRKINNLYNMTCFFFYLCIFVLYLQCVLVSMKVVNCLNLRLFNPIYCQTGSNLTKVVTRTLIGGLDIHIFMFCRTSFSKIKFNFINLKRNLPDKTWICEYTPPNNVLVAALLICVSYIFLEYPCMLPYKEILI